MDHAHAATGNSAVIEWLDAFQRALTLRDRAALAALFATEAHWRDIIAFTWQFTTLAGRDAIAASLAHHAVACKLQNIRLPPRRTPPRDVNRAGVSTIEVIFEFTTASGIGNGVVRLITEPTNPGHLLAWTLVTTLEDLHATSDPQTKPEQSRQFGGDNWLDKRNKARAYADHDPTVIVVGGGQAGLAIAARLTQFGIDTLIVDRETRIGDNWRKCYHSLTLHNEIHVNHMPFMPFPATWPVYIPKDKLANWFEAYVESLELNFWTETELVGGGYDDKSGTWHVTLRHRDGTQRAMRPRHLVFATGVSSIPKQPTLPGLENFAGTIMHSGEYVEGARWHGRPALVLGTGTSGHDVAQDLHAHGADVTLIQRRPTYVISLREAQVVYAIYQEGIPIADCDLLATSMPYPVMKRSYQISTAASREVDRDLLAGLAARGFRLEFGEDQTGFQMKYLRHGGGYYFNVGCPDLIIEGKIGLLNYADIERFAPEGAHLRDGRIIPADLLVLATGYLNQQEVVRTTLGDAIADRIGPVWGFDDGNELRNMWRPTAQTGLWFTAGSLAQCRIYSRYLALQILARERGVVSDLQ